MPCPLDRPAINFESISSKTSRRGSQTRPRRPPQPSSRPLSCKFSSSDSLNDRPLSTSPHHAFSGTGTPACAPFFDNPISPNPNSTRSKPLPSIQLAANHIPQIPTSQLTPTHPDRKNPASFPNLKILTPNAICIPSPHSASVILGEFSPGEKVESWTPPLNSAADGG
jgi:hypothetical protein